MRSAVTRSLKIERPTIDFQGINLLSRLAVGASFRARPLMKKSSPNAGWKSEIAAPNRPIAGNHAQATRLLPRVGN